MIVNVQFLGTAAAAAVAFSLLLFSAAVQPPPLFVDRTRPLQVLLWEPIILHTNVRSMAHTGITTVDAFSPIRSTSHAQRFRAITLSQLSPTATTTATATTITAATTIHTATATAAATLHNRRTRMQLGLGDSMGVSSSSLSSSMLWTTRQQRQQRPSQKQIQTLLPSRHDHPYRRRKNSNSNSPSSSSSLLVLSMFLPPDGGGGKKGNTSSSTELSELTSTIVTLLAVTAFFVSPLGGIFFALFNSFVAFLILAPITAIAAFNLWEYFNTITGTCPNCNSPIKVLTDEATPTICFNCGAIVQSKDGNIYLANSNNINSNNDDGRMKNAKDNGNMFTTILEEMINTNARTNDDEDDSLFGRGIQRPQSSKKNSPKNTVIDVDVIED
jgi:hypothetical protein